MKMASIQNQNGDDKTKMQCKMQIYKNDLFPYIITVQRFILNINCNK